MADVEYRRHPGHAGHADPQDAEPRADARLRHRAAASSRSRAASSRSTRARCSPRCSGSSAPAGSTPNGARPSNSRRAKFYTLTRAGRKQLDVETADWTRRVVGGRAPAQGRGLSPCRSGASSRAAFGCSTNRIGRRPGRRRRSAALPRAGDRGARRARALARGRAPRRTAGARQRDQRPRAGARLRLGERGRHAARRSALRRAPAASGAGLHRRRRAHAGARHRRHDGDLQRRQPDPVRAAAVPGRRPDRDDSGNPERRGDAIRERSACIASSRSGRDRSRRSPCSGRGSRR